MTVYCHICLHDWKNTNSGIKVKAKKMMCKHCKTVFIVEESAIND